MAQDGRSCALSRPGGQEATEETGAVAEEPLQAESRDPFLLTTPCLLLIAEKEPPTCLMSPTKSCF